MRTRRLGLGTINILQALAAGRAFGFDIMDATGLTSGTVYPALERLEELGFVRSKWESETTAHRDGRPARRYFEITPAGSRAMEDALERYPKSTYAEKCRDRLNEGRRKLADHEMYVAKFYWKRDKYLAAAGRAEALVRDYSGLGLDAEALLLAARARQRLGQDDLAREIAARIVRDHKAAAEADDAAQLGPRGVLVGLLEDGADDRRDHAPRRARHEVLGVAGEVDPAALPGGAQELLAHGGHETAVVVADDEPDPR